MATVASERLIHGESTAEDLVKEEVFKQTYIPQRLDDVRNFFQSFLSYRFALKKFASTLLHVSCCLGHVLRERYSPNKIRRENRIDLYNRHWNQAGLIWTTANTRDPRQLGSNRF